MKRVFGVCLFIIAFIIGLNAQDEQAFELLERLGVIQIDGYYFNHENAKDSLLVTKEYFNRRGRRTQIAIFDSIGKKGSYQFIYEFDTLKVERRTYKEDDLISITRIINNKYGKEVETIDYDEKWRKTGWRSIRKYNKHQDEVSFKLYVHKRLVSHTKKWYYGPGKIKKDKTIRPKLRKETINYAIDGSILSHKTRNPITTVELPGKFGYEKIIKKTIEFGHGRAMLTFEGFKDFKENDVFVSEYYYYENGLIAKGKQYLNDVLIGVKKYKYIFAKF